MLDIRDNMLNIDELNKCIAIFAEYNNLKEYPHFKSVTGITSEDDDVIFTGKTDKGEETISIPVRFTINYEHYEMLCKYQKVLNSVEEFKKCIKVLPKFCDNTGIQLESNHMEKNWCYQITDMTHPHFGETLWSGRYCAVAAFIFCRFKDGWYVLANQRGKGTPDFQGMWNCPCGFLENTESGPQGCAREAFEETGFIIDPRDLILHSVETEPEKCNKGHVTLRYYAFIEQEDLDPNKNVEDPANLKGGEQDEVENIKWIALRDIDKYEWAFNHKYVIDKLFNELIPYGDYHLFVHTRNDLKYVGTFQHCESEDEAEEIGYRYFYKYCAEHPEETSDWYNYEIQPDEDCEKIENIIPLDKVW